MRSRQLKFVFAASPPGGGKSGPSDASAGRDFLLHTANSKTANDLSASAADASRLLEAVASPANLATAPWGQCACIHAHGLLPTGRVVSEQLRGDDRGLPERLVPRATGVTGFHMGRAQPPPETGLWSNAVVRPVRTEPQEPDVGSTSPVL